MWSYYHQQDVADEFKKVQICKYSFDLWIMQGEFHVPHKLTLPGKSDTPACAKDFWHPAAGGGARSNSGPPTPPTGRDSSVGIATRYGLDGPGIESR
jgi:hypothetical protein